MKIFRLTSTNKKNLITFLKPFKKIVLVGGCFDILHFGHIMFLKNAKKLSGALVVLLESDETIKRKKKRGPIHDQKKRAQLVAAISYVDAVIMLPYLKRDQEYERLTQLIKPSFIAVTRGDKLLAHKEHQARLVGAHVRQVTPHIGGLSTSRITTYASISGN